MYRRISLLFFNHFHYEYPLISLANGSNRLHDDHSWTHDHPCQHDGIISAWQYMKEARALIRQNPSARKKMWILVTLLPTLYVVLPYLWADIGIRDITFPLALLMYAYMFIGTKKILWPVFWEQKDKLWKFAVIYPVATFILSIALVMIVWQVFARIVYGL